MPKLAEITKKHARAWKDIEKPNGIRPIETIYNGYRFRSRLEARWAVFFDTAGIPFEYEPEGFVLKNDVRYLPDFYLPWFKCFVEVKRKNIPDEDRKKAISKLEELFVLHGDCCTMLVEGDPMDSEMTVYCNDVTDSSGGGPLPWKAQFIEGGWFEGGTGLHSGGKHFITLCLGEDRDRFRTFHTADFGFLPSVEQLCCLDKDGGYRSKLEHAKETARQARFEHGEQPDQRAIGKLLPVGDYDYEVVNMERDRFKGSDKLSACPVAVLQIRCVNEQTSGIGLCRLYLNSKMVWRITEFFKSCGLIPADAPEGTKFSMKLFEQVVGRTGKVRVTITKNEHDGSTYKSNSYRFIVPGK